MPARKLNVGTVNFTSDIEMRKILQGLTSNQHKILAASAWHMEDCGEYPFFAHLVTEIPMPHSTIVDNVNELDLKGIVTKEAVKLPGRRKRNWRIILTGLGKGLYTWALMHHIPTYYRHASEPDEEEDWGDDEDWDTKTKWKKERGL